MAAMKSREKQGLIIEILIGWKRSVIINLTINENAPCFEKRPFLS